MAELAAQRHPAPRVYDNQGYTVRAQRHFTNAIKSALRTAGVGHLRGHDLRHSASSILQALGLPPLAAMEVLGHASPDVTMGIYGHLLSASRRQAADLMDGYLDQLEGPAGGASPASRKRLRDR